MNQFKSFIKLYLFLTNTFSYFWIFNNFQLTHSHFCDLPQAQLFAYICLIIKIIISQKKEKLKLEQRNTKKLKIRFFIVDLLHFFDLKNRELPHALMLWLQFHWKWKWNLNLNSALIFITRNVSQLLYNTRY